MTTGTLEMESSNNAAADRDAVHDTRVVAITSGKGGVGKTSICANAAIALQRRRKKILVIDADLGLANIDVILGIRPQYTLHDLLKNDRDIDDILVRGPRGIDILPAGSGVGGLDGLEEGQRLLLAERLDSLNGRYDLILIDTSAGINSNVVFFNLAAQSIVVVATPEPTSRTDAYALIKVMSRNHGRRRFFLLVNQAGSDAEARRVYQSLAETADRYLDRVSLGFLGFIRSDPRVGDAVRLQRPAVEEFPQSEFTQDVSALGLKLASLPEAGGLGRAGMLWRQALGAAGSDAAPI